MGIVKICIQTVEIRFVCNNHIFQSSLLFHLTIFLSTGEILSLSRLSSLCFLHSHHDSDLHLLVSVLVWCCSLQQSGSLQSSPVNPHVIIWAACSVFIIIYLLLLESLLKILLLLLDSVLNVWYSLNLMVSKMSFIADKQARQISMPVTSIMCLKGTPHPLCTAVRCSTQSVQ